MPDGPLWIFGYGSLVWRPAFAWVEAHPARIEGYRRVFWQGSTDHRGLPGAPGRVVTLARDPRAVCFGRVFRVPEGDEAPTLAALDHRERGGYERLDVDAALLADATRGAARVRAVAYAATPANPNYLGPADARAIARQVRAARGPSGANVDYVLELAAALRAMGADDAHVFEIEQLLLAERGP